MALDLDDLEGQGLTGSLTADDFARLTGDEATPAPAAPAQASTTQRVTIVMESGERYDATLDARDRRAYAMHADRFKLPAFTLEAGTANLDVLKLELLTMFSAWHATRYRLKLHSLDWPAFNAGAVECITLPDVEVEPYPLAPGAG